MDLQELPWIVSGFAILFFYISTNNPLNLTFIFFLVCNIFGFRIKFFINKAQCTRKFLQRSPSDTFFKIAFLKKLYGSQKLLRESQIKPLPRSSSSSSSSNSSSSRSSSSSSSSSSITIITIN